MANVQIFERPALLRSLIFCSSAETELEPVLRQRRIRGSLLRYLLPILLPAWLKTAAKSNHLLDDCSIGKEVSVPKLSEINATKELVRRLLTTEQLRQKR
jgi:hypothetical protein